MTAREWVAAAFTGERDAVSNGAAELIPGSASALMLEPSRS
jgi:hypothetical protein